MFFGGRHLARAGTRGGVPKRLANSGPQSAAALRRALAPQDQTADHPLAIPNRERNARAIQRKCHTRRHRVEAGNMDRELIIPALSTITHWIHAQQNAVRLVASKYLKGVLTGSRVAGVPQR